MQRTYQHLWHVLHITVISYLRIGLGQVTIIVKVKYSETNYNQMITVFVHIP